jgi:hypothetical protein
VNFASLPTKSSANALGDSTNITWTRSWLEKERGDWWDTQVTGSQEIWAAIRLAAEHLQKGELAEAQTMLDATDCTCPTGLLWNGVYDPPGNQYKVPEWVVVEPEGLAEEEVLLDEGVAGLGGASAKNEGMQEEDDTANEPVKVRVRMSHNQRDVLLDIGKRDSVATIVGKLKWQAKVR